MSGVDDKIWMEVRRIGNVCLAARGGWQARLETAVQGYRVSWWDGKGLVSGTWERTPEEAFAAGADVLDARMRL